MTHHSCSSSQLDSSASELYDQIKAEFGDSVYESNQLFDKIFNTSFPQDLGGVIQDCINEFRGSLPPMSGDERDYYVSFVKRLNIVKESLERHKLMEGSIYKDVLFEICDEVMKERTKNSAGPPPDIIARVPPPRPTLKKTTGNVSWMNVEFCVEVKGQQYAEMVAQGATYARSIMAAQRSRYFVLIIFYEQKSANVSFGLFTPAWLCLSSKINIETTDGQRQFIWDMARIWSCKSRWSAGFDLTCNNTTCYLEGYGTFSIQREIFHRISIAGRRTRVDIITDGKADNTQTDNSHSGIVVYGFHEYTSHGSSTATQESSESRTQSSGTRRSARLLAKAKAHQGPAPSASTLLPPKTSSHTNRPCDLSVFHSPPLYKKLILKDSWPILSREKQEEEVFGEVGSKFGVPKILGSFAVKIQKDNGETVKSDTAWFFPDSATKLGLWRSRSNKSSGTSQSSNQKNTNNHEGPEHRVHVRLPIQTEGKPLYQAEGPKQLVQAILHAMIGYWVILKNGWIHRDVSSGNVLLMETPEKRDKIEGFEDILTENILAKYFDKCTGFISDGDLAVKWENMNREIAKQRSGTPPFMSRRLIYAAYKGSRVPHSAIDDLESFVWVLFSAVLHAMRSRGAKLSTDEEVYWSCLQSLDLQQLQLRVGFERSLKVTAQEIKSGVHVNVSRAFKPFVGLLLDWLSFADELEFNAESPFSANYPVSLQSHIKRYLEIGIMYLEELPDNWDYIKESSQTTSSASPSS